MVIYKISETMENEVVGFRAKVKAWFAKPLNVMWMSLALSLYTLVAFHMPLFGAVVDTTSPGWNRIFLLFSGVMLIAAVNFAVYYILLYGARIVGKVIISILLLGNSIALYFINSYEVLLSREMMGNVFNTNAAEATSYFSFGAVLYVLLLGVLPVVWLIWRKVEYGKVGRFLKSIAAVLGIVVVVVIANMGNTLWVDSGVTMVGGVQQSKRNTVNMGNMLWVDHNATQLGSLFLPWSYAVNSVRFFNHQRAQQREAIVLPDVSSVAEGKDVVVLVIGESARSANFSLYGYERITNPLLSEADITVYKARASATYTTAGVKAILSHKPVDEPYEILPEYLERAGMDVMWRTSNSGEPKMHLASYLKPRDLEQIYPDGDARYDEILIEGLKEEIENSESDKMLIVLHTSTSHGPTYNKKYPMEFERFTPVCTTVEMSDADPASLINAYDNTILYTDYLLNSIIELLSQVEGRRSAMIYVSDHGESLGERGLFMHGMPMSMAPSEQVDIPFIVWTSDDATELKPFEEVGHYHVFHSVLGFLGVESEVYNPEYDIFMPRVE